MADSKNTNAPGTSRGVRSAGLGRDLRHGNCTGWNAYRQPWNAAAEAHAAMSAAGFATSDSIDTSGKLQRLRKEGSRDRNLWCVATTEFFVAGDWTTGARVTGHASFRSEITDAEKRQVWDAQKAERRKREHATARSHARGCIAAGQLLAQAAPAHPEHAYLMAKAVQPNGALQLDDKLVLRMVDTAGKVWNAQTITGDGEKRFLPGAKKKGLYFPIGRPVVDVLLIAEGFATAATLHEATGHPVACAFDCGNLEPVALALRAKYPAVKIVLCADDDHETEARTGKNPGIDFATAAALAVGGFIARPKFPEALRGLTDFNDLRQWMGDAPVVDAMGAAA